MITEDVGRQLHDRATRGMPLSADEQAELEAWYAQRDAEESAVLVESGPPQRLTALRAQVDEVASQLLVVTQRIQAQVAENESIRREIVELQR